MFRPSAYRREEVAPDNPNLGVMLPYTPLHHLLLAELGFPVVATSGNLTDEPICTDELDAFERLGPSPTPSWYTTAPSPATSMTAWRGSSRGVPRLLRRARGYAPLPVLLNAEAPTILAVGAHLKNTVALSVGRQAFISQHIGDLETPEAMAAFERVIADFLQMYEATPVAIAHDLHPEYLSTKWALEQVDRRPGSQRHEQTQGANLEPATCHPSQSSTTTPTWPPAWRRTQRTGRRWASPGMAPVMAPTARIWGGEFLLGDASGFTRVAHLRPFRLLGGDAAVYEPRRVALALLCEMYGDAALEMDDLVPVRAFSVIRAPPVGPDAGTRRQCAGHHQRRPALRRRRRADRAAPRGQFRRSGCDGAGVRGRRSAKASLPYCVGTAGDGGGQRGFIAPRRQGVIKRTSAPRPPAPPLILDWQPMVEAILADLRAGVERGIIAARFHGALVDAIVAVARSVGAQRVALTGGCFQNRRLTERAADRLERAGFEVILHRLVPPNDGGISLGQVAVAAARLRKIEDRRQESATGVRGNRGVKALIPVP